MLVIALVGWLIGHLLTRKLARLAAVADAVSDGDLSPRARLAGRDEVARVGRAFDGMVDRLEQRLETIRLDRDRLILPTEAINEGFVLWDAAWSGWSGAINGSGSCSAAPTPRSSSASAYEAFLNGPFADAVADDRHELAEAHRAAFCEQHRTTAAADRIRAARRPLAAGQQVAPAGRQRDRHLHRHHRGQAPRARAAGERAAAAGDHGFRGRRASWCWTPRPGCRSPTRPRPRSSAATSRPMTGRHVDELLVPQVARLPSAPAPGTAPRWSASAATASRFPAEVSMGVLCRSSGVRIATVRDVTLQKADRDRMLLQATHDELTGLPNRRLFDDRLDMTLRRAGRIGRAGGGGVPGRRPVQDGQRQPRARHGRSAAGGAQPPPAGQPARQRHRGPHGRRRVHLHPARPAAAGGRGAAGAQAAGGGARAGADRRAGAVRHRQHRRRRVPDRRPGARHAAAPRRRRALPGQGARPQPLRAVRPRPGDRRPPTRVRARRRPAARRRPGRAEPGLPAADQLPHRQGRGLRGADALASPAARAGLARHVHPDRRGDRPDLGPGRLGPGAGLPRHGRPGTAAAWARCGSRSTSRRASCSTTIWWARSSGCCAETGLAAAAAGAGVHRDGAAARGRGDRARPSPACVRSGSAWRWTISAPATRRSAICASTRSSG